MKTLNNDVSQNQTINILKGIAAICVIIGHSVQRAMPEMVFTDFFLVKIIYTFHMPLFALLSGYVLYISKSNIDFNWIKKRFIRLMIPFISWNLIIWFMRDLSFTGLKPAITFPDTIMAYIRTQIIYPDYILWFLYMIFICSLLYFIANKISKKNIDIVLMGIGILLQVLPGGYLGSGVVKMYFPIFIAGYFACKYKEYLSKYMNMLLIVSIIIFPILAPQWSWQKGVIYKYVVALTAIVIIYALVKKLRNNSIQSFFSYMGKISLELYMVQCIVLNIGIGTGMFRALSIFITTTTISVLIIELIKRNYILNLILFGVMSKENRVKKS